MEIIEQIGSYAGLAAIVGLAVLSALYFSQARDVKRLREWAGRAPERAAQPAVPAPQRVVAQPQPKPAGTTPPAVPTPAGQQSAAPKTPTGPPQIPAPPVPAVAAAAGAAPATAVAEAAGSAGGAPMSPAAAATADRPSGPGAATPAGQGKQAPTDPKEPDTAAGDGAAKPDAAVPAPQGQQEGTPQASAGTATPPADTGTPPADAKTPPPDATTPPTGTAGTPPATTPPASGQSPGQPPPAALPPTARPATPAGQARPTPPTPPRFSRPAPPARPAPEQTVIIPPGSGNGAPAAAGGLSRTRIAVLAVAGVLVLGGGAAFAISQLTGDDSGPTTSQAPSGGDEEEPGGDGQGNGGQAVNPADVTVAVLNGTLVAGLAAAIGDEVEQLGFDLGTLGNANDQEQQRAESVVLYADGHRREAVVVSRRLKIPQREEIDPETQALAGDATVVVSPGPTRRPSAAPASSSEPTRGRAEPGAARRAARSRRQRSRAGRVPGPGPCSRAAGRP